MTTVVLKQGDRVVYRGSMGEYRGRKATVPVSYVFTKRDAEGVGQGGINIYLDRNGSSVIDMISGGDGVLDPIGANAARHHFAYRKLPERRLGRHLHFGVLPDHILSRRHRWLWRRCQFPYGEGAKTVISPCMKVYSKFLSRPQKQ